MKVLFWERESSQPETRFIPLAHGQALGLRGGFHKVQIIDQFSDQIIEEYKSGIVIDGKRFN